ncbi:MAG: hypothetical protein D6758_12355 [Gammaproteobacteria bacterium]|nr:MAG: hypothetical protein D6758_12355 [Gammaproteobacteria bacterium]
MPWQLLQSSVVTKCPEFLPVAVVPLWQASHRPVMLLWSKLAGVQARVVWQVTQSAVVVMWLEGLPVDVLPLWQASQRPVMLL